MLVLGLVVEAMVEWGHLDVFANGCAYARMRAWMYICAYVHVHACVRSGVCARRCVHASVHVRVCARSNVYARNLATESSPQPRACSLALLNLVAHEHFEVIELVL